jgi:hypothetical protein
MVLALLAVATPAFAITVTVNGQAIGLNPAPIERAGRVFVPLRGVFENLGATVVYENGVINATAGSQTVSLTIGSRQATVDGQDQTLDVAPFIIGASTYVPLRFVSQALGATVDYDGSNQTVAVITNSAPAPAADPYPATTVSVDVPPPPIPVYEQPPCPQPNLIWTPGHWAWGPYGYYWVPGTWVAAPEPGYLWTPGYWSYAGANYGWHPGYWGIHIGFYGGINYGFGYFGHDYVGGRWEGNNFRYNTAVTNINKTVITNTYIDTTVVNNYNKNVEKVSYNGGPKGVHATPTPEERAAAQTKHIAATPEQKEHLANAAKDRDLLTTVNKGKPAAAAVERPYTAEHPAEHVEPVRDEDRAAAAVHLKKGSAQPEETTKLNPEFEKPRAAVKKPEAKPAPEKPKDKPEPKSS